MMAVPISVGKKLTLLDPTTNETYTIIISNDDAERAGQDLVFATQLFNQAKLQASVAAKQDNAGKIQIVTKTSNSTPTPMQPASAPAVIKSPCSITAEARPSGSKDPDETIDNFDEKEDGNCTWTRPMVLLLIRLYKEKESNFINGRMSQKLAWENLSKTMLEHGYEVPGSKCASKLSSLKRTYKTVKDHNSKSGNDRRTWQFLEVMDELFCDKPWIKPISTASSDGHSESDSGVSNQSSDPGSSSAHRTALKRKRQSMMEQLIEEKKTYREAKQRQHDEKIREARRLSNILKKLLATKSKYSDQFSAEDDMSD